MLRNRWALIGLLLALMVALTACGDGDDGGEAAAAPADEPTTTTEERISEDDWVDGAHDACVTWHEVGAALADVDDDEEYYGRLTDLAEEYAEDLADLGTPEDIEDEADGLVDAVEDLADVLAQSEDIVEEGDDPDDDEEFSDAFADASDAADDAADEADIDCAPADPETPATTSPPAADPPSSEPTSVLDLAPLEPSSIIGNYGSDLLLDSYADLCFNGDMGACDGLYQESPVDESIYSYEGYGATCGGRLSEESPGDCVALS